MTTQPKRNLDKSAARYFAQNAYKLSVYNGIEQVSATTQQYGFLTITRNDGYYHVDQQSTGIAFDIKIAKSWIGA